ncbi:MAG: hypothetical protein V2A54_10640 [Bacteroidota bacterium]
MKKITFPILALGFFFTQCNATSPNEKKETYDQLLKRVQTKRDSLGTAYKAANENKKKDLIVEARNFVFTTITKDIFDFWYGTPWDFNGTTKVPKQGKIACGYFITTILQAGGFDIPRVAWAQLAAEAIVKKMTPDIKRFNNRPVSEVEDYIGGRDDGLYIVGLDCHVGFIYKKGSKIKFVHSNYYKKEEGVMSENLDTTNPLKDSKYRVIGRLLDDAMMKKWLMNEKME